jgi:hypothetical protein
VFGVQNIYISAIRVYTALDIGNRGLYDLALLTNLGVLAMFASEMFVWRTVGARVRAILILFSCMLQPTETNDNVVQESVFPFVNAGVGIVWMMAQRGWYLA